MECYTKEVKQKVASRFGACEEIQILERTKEEDESFFRIRDQSLRRGIKWIALVHGKMWGAVRYETLPQIFFFCGHIGHTLKYCSLTLEDLSGEKKENLRYGEWMSVDT